MTRAPWLNEAKRAGLADVCERLGLPHRERGRRSDIGCPACGAERRGDGDKRLPASVVGEGRWKCWACGEGGDVVDLVAHVLCGGRYTGQSEVRAWWAGATMPAVDRGGRDTAPAPPHYLAQDEALTLLRRAGRGARGAVRGWMASKLGHAAHVVEHRVWTLPLRARHPEWAHFGGRPWAEQGYQLLVPVWDAAGELRGVRARQVRHDATGPKALPPTGYDCRGLVLASPRARWMLAGDTGPNEIIVCEGESDWLAWMAARPHAAVVGIGSGWWTTDHADRVPTGCRVVLATDDDASGDRYAEQVRATLGGRCEIVRWKPPGEG